MLIPTEAIATAPAISSAPANSSATASSSALAGLSARKPPVSLGIPGSDLPDSGIHPARFPLSPLAFPWLFPNGWPHVYPERAGIPKLEGGCHSSLGSSGDISISHSGVTRGHRNVSHASVSLYATSPDSSGLCRPPNRTPFCSNGSFPPRPTSLPDRLNRAAPAHPQTISLHGGTIHNNATELVSASIHGTLPAQWNHTISYTHTLSYTLSNKSKHVRLLQERRPNSPHLITLTS